MPTRRDNNKKFAGGTLYEDFFNEPWKLISATIVGISTLIGIGFGLGRLQLSNDVEIAKIKMQNECAVKIQEERNNYKKLEKELYNREIQEIKSALKELEDNKQQ